MKNFVVYLAVIVCALFIADYLVEGFEVTQLPGAIVAALLLVLSNLFIRPILLILTLPLNILTLGLFSFVISGAILMGVASVVEGFSIASWSAAIWGGVVIAVSRILLHALLPRQIDGR